VSRGTGHPVIVLAAAVLALLAVRAAAPFLAAPPAAADATAVARTGASAPAPAPPRAAVASLDEPTATRLLLGGEDGLLRVDIDAHTVQPIPLPGRAFEADQGLVKREGTVVAVHGGTAYAASGAPDRPATRLGPASYALASADPRRVWLIEQTGDPDRWFRVREVAVAGPGPAQPGVLARGTLPLGHRPMAGVPGGLLVGVAGPGGGLAVWNPRTGRTRTRLEAGSPVVVATSGGTVAWVEGPALHLADLATGRDRVVAAPDGSDGFTPTGAFSPDGRLLAAVTRGGFSTRPALALVAVDRAAAVRVAGSDGALADRCSPCLAWAPAGDWVFFNRLGPGFSIGAYRLDRPRAATVPLELPGSLPPSFVAI
jgi:hypothetical protein